MRLRKSGEAGRVFLRNPRPAGQVRPATVAPAPGRPRPRLEGPGQRLPAVTPLLPSCASLFQPLSTVRMIFSRARHLALAHADARPRRGPGPRAKPGAAFPWLGGSAPQSPLLSCRGADVLIPPPPPPPRPSPPGRAAIPLGFRFLCWWRGPGTSRLGTWDYFERRQSGRSRSRKSSLPSPFPPNGRDLNFPLRRCPRPRPRKRK